MLPYKSSSFYLGRICRMDDKLIKNMTIGSHQMFNERVCRLIKSSKSMPLVFKSRSDTKFIDISFSLSSSSLLEANGLSLLFFSYRQWQYDREKDPFEIRLPIVLASFKRINRMRWQNACDTSPFGLDNSIVGMEWLSRCITLIAFVPTVIKRWKNFENDMPGPLIK